MRFAGYSAIAALLLIALLLVGCSRSTSPTTTSPPPMGKATAGQVMVMEKEWSITLDPDTVKAGSIEFHVMNEGKYAHSMEIEGPGVEQSLPSNVDPSQSTTLTLDLKAGKYNVYCPIGGHAGNGMKATLTVME